jgi:hypothetical protein
LKQQNENKRTLFLSLLAIAVFTCIYYLPQLIAGRPLFSTNLYQFSPWRHFATPEDLQQPVNTMLSDPLVVFFPLYTYAQSCLREWVAPLWNPNLMCGHPLIADGTVAMFYPLKWMFLGLDTSRLLLFGALLRIFLAGAFMYLYLKHLDLGVKVALFGAVCFMFNGYFIIWNEYPTFVESALWLPLMFLLVEKMLKHGNWKFVLLLGLVMSMSILAGMFQIALYNLYATGVYVLWRGIGERKRLGKMGLRLLFLGSATSVILALMLSAVQILPFYELISNSHRQKVDLKQEFFPGVCPPEFMVQYLMPEFFGSHTEHNFWYLGMAQHMNEDLKNTAWSANLSELSGYTGAIVFLLALAGIAGRKERFSLFFVLLILLSRLPIFSKAALSLYYYAIPGFQTSVAQRLGFLYAFSIVSLAAIGLNKIISATGQEGFERKHRWILKICWYMIAFSFVFLLIVKYLKSFDTDYLSAFFATNDSLPSRINGYCIAVLAAGYFWPHTLRSFIVFIGSLGVFGLTFFLFKKRNLSPTLFVYSVILLTLAELLYFQYRMHPIQKRNPYFTTGSIEFLQKNLGTARIARFGNLGLLAFDTGLVYGLRDSQGYVAFVLDRVSDSLKQVDERAVAHERWAIPFTNRMFFENGMFDLLSVKYILTDLKTHLNDRRFKRVFEDGIRIYEYSDHLPRAFVVHQYQVVPAKDTLLKKIKENAVDLKETVLLEEVPDGDVSVPVTRGDEDVKFSYDGPNEVRLTVNTSGDGFLVLNDTFYPGWRASVDGVGQKIYRANYMFRAVFVPAGNHEVAFHYRPSSIIIGAVISGITLLAALGALFIPSGRRSRRKGPALVASSSSAG